MRGARLRLPALITLAAGIGIYSWTAEPPGDSSSATSEQSAARPALVPNRTGSISITRIRAPGPTSDKSEEPNPLARLKRERLRETIARPLFSPSRRPPPKPTPRPVKRVVKTPPPARIPVNPFTLVGIISRGSKRVALMRHGGNGMSFRVAEGDRLGDWRLQQVTATSVTLAGRTAAVTLQLFKK